jgi:ABC-2 type transport system ATP-binding protein
MSAAVTVRGVGKQYLLGQLQGGYTLLSEAISERLRSVGKGKTARDSFWALEDIDFEVAKGETFGIIGHNGAGKSTLLKILARVTPPTTGEIRLHGRVGALLEVGTGFQAELTGRENIFLNAAILGMTEAETAEKFDDIVKFADIGRFLDSPVGNYSSGMFARLGFAVAIHVDSDIFLADEVLAVGDKPFKRKCLEKMQEIRDGGRTLFYVSHAAGSVRKMCDRLIVLEKGRVAFDGDVDEGIRFLKYEDDTGRDPEGEDAEDEELGADI